MKNDKLRQKRLRKAYFVGRILARFPYVQCVILNGSLTGNKHKESSDIDILIIARNKHIFSARFFINFWTIIFGLKRLKNSEKPHAGKFCFNYFLTENYLRIPTGRGDKIDRYCADNYSQSVYIAGNRRLFDKFLSSNKKLFNKFDCHPALDAGSRKISSRFRISSLQSGMTKQVQRFWEMIFGIWFEKWARKYQIKNIESDPRTKKYPDLIVFTDKELRFHPPNKLRKK